MIECVWKEKTPVPLKRYLAAYNARIEASSADKIFQAAQFYPEDIDAWLKWRKIKSAYNFTTGTTQPTSPTETTEARTLRWREIVQLKYVLRGKTQADGHCAIAKAEGVTEGAVKKAIDRLNTKEMSKSKPPKASPLPTVWP